ncbi:cbb3-type cytochrome oxidase assembly protein CcoS [Ectothiorhodospiraceae bacterium BW-2]|nr:cbb3-type cytochrome oxidase assembly protein CcoS [Ectothiorhodospiraceae bacterium BW-2]
MEVIYSLIPGMIFLGLILVGVLIWAVRRGQYDDLDGDGQRILMDEDEEMMQNSVANKRGRNWPDAD